MKTVAENYAASFHRPGRSADTLFDDLLLAKIGDDLRHLYTEVTDSEQPRTLLDLAEEIDARRSGNGPQD